jgi:hypothetical protein
MSRKSKINDWTTPENLELVSCWARDGYIDTEIAAKMGIAVRTFYRWRSQSRALKQALQNGKEVIDNKVESALLKAALGGKTEDVKVKLVHEKDQQVRKIVEKTTREHPPNVLACQTWLFNRQRDKWKRNRDNEFAAEDDQTINITIRRQESGDKCQETE